jgi:hypothetical protein
MKIKELIRILQKINPEEELFILYNGQRLMLEELTPIQYENYNLSLILRDWFEEIPF